jgi:hypothetical protein
MPKLHDGSAKIRRTLELPASAISDLAKIKDATSAKNDTAAINDAISFRARLAGHDLQEIKNALAVFDQVKQISKTGSSLVTQTEEGMTIEPANGLIKEPQERPQRPTRTFIPTVAFG